MCTISCNENEEKISLHLSGSHIGLYTYYLSLYLISFSSLRLALFSLFYILENIVYVLEFDLWQAYENQTQLLHKIQVLKTPLKGL